MSELYSYQKDQLPLQELIQLPLASGTLGLFYTPARCQLGRWEDGKLSERGKALALDQVFEARLFHPSAEWRWLRDPSTDNLGDAVCLFDSESDAPINLKKAGWQLQPSLNDLSVQENHYLLWGEYWKVDNLVEGWSCLADARVGELFVPLPNLQPNQRVRLKTLEYFGLPRDADGKLTLHGQHGNYVVVEERWLCLEVI